MELNLTEDEINALIAEAKNAKPYVDDDDVYFDGETDFAREASTLARSILKGIGIDLKQCGIDD